MYEDKLVISLLSLSEDIRDKEPGFDYSDQNSEDYHPDVNQDGLPRCGIFPCPDLPDLSNLPALNITNSTGSEESLKNQDYDETQLLTIDEMVKGE